MKKGFLLGKHFRPTLRQQNGADAFSCDSPVGVRFVTTYLPRPRNILDLAAGDNEDVL